MASKIIISPSADQDLKSILSFIAEDSPERALHFVDELQEKAKTILGTFPESGHVFKQDQRYITIKRYVLVYEYHAQIDTVYILEVHAPGKNWKAEK